MYKLITWIKAYQIVLIAGMVAYEYVITFDQEVAQVWMRRPTATSLLLLSTRWVMAGNQAILVLPALPSKCK